MKANIQSSKAFMYGIAGAGAGFMYAIFAFVVEMRFGADYEAMHILVAPFLGGIAAFVIGRESERIHHQSDMLSEAKRKFSTLTHDAITKKDWNVSFKDPSIPTCWEVKNCESMDCPSYGKKHVRCWLIAGTYCRGEVQGHFAQKLGDCAKCEIYQMSFSRDPINEIGENFNSLMWALREKEDMLTETNSELQKQYSELELMHKQAREMADTDMLTGLRNHAHFQRHLQWEVERAQRFNRPLSLVMLDLDHFKDVNDHFGHQKGDEVLQRVGKLIRHSVRGMGYSARYGGEEFAIVLPDMTAKKAMEIADRIRRDMAIVEADVSLPAGLVGGSFGVADLPHCASDADSLISASDSALLFAKRKGRNQVAYFCDLSNTELREGDMDKLHTRLEGASLQTIRALAEAVDANDDYSEANTTRMAHVAIAIADRLGMNQQQCDALALATRLHDIGKVGVPGSVLRKKEKLSAEEMSQVQLHPEIGQRLLHEAEQIQDLISAILYHHERWDGDGYPERLAGEEIPVMARVVGIMDAYRAMLCDRPYRKALKPDDALEEVRKGSGTQFDPQLVDIFVELVKRGEGNEMRESA
ncbi:MAG: diguanylate cyclase [Thermoleophilia bacterium]|nr:diguanylate cyclase [Thermoleophilia bacterium]